MTTLVIDASVWVSAADATDGLSESSRSFLSLVVDRELPISLPELAKLEIACALARRLRDAERGRCLADRLLGSPLVTVYPLNRTMLRHGLTVGTQGFCAPVTLPTPPWPTGCVPRSCRGMAS